MFENRKHSLQGRSCYSKRVSENDTWAYNSSAKRNEVELYFVDAAHFVMGAFLGYLLCKWRVCVRTPSGRKRYNVLGAYNAVTGAMVSVTNAGNCR